jgi:hypothetical protein
VATVELRTHLADRKGKDGNPPPTAGALALYPDLRIKENTLPSDTYPTQSGTARVPRVGECAVHRDGGPLFIRDENRMR